MATIRDRYILEVDTQGAERGVAKSKGSIASLGAGIARLGPLAVAAGGALAGMAAVEGLSNTINQMDDLAKSARLAGAAASEDAFKGFQVLQQAMAEAGIDAATFDRAMLQTTSRLQEGIEGNKAFAEIVGKLGDSVKTSEGDLVDGATALQAMINALNEGTISTDEFAKVVGGRAGPLIQQQFASLNTNAETLAATLADVEANSNIVSLDAASNAEAFNDTMGRLGTVAGQLGTQITEALLPILLELAEGALQVLPPFIDGVKEAFSRMEPVINVIGTIFSELVVPILSTFFDLISALATVLEPVVSLLADGLVGAIRAVGDILETVIARVQSFIDSLGAIGEKVSQVTGAVGNKFSEMKNGVVNSTREAYDGVTGWFGAMYDEVVGNSIVPDMTRGVLGSFDELSGGMVSRIASAIPAITNKFRDVAGSIGEYFEQFTGISLSNIRSQVGTLTNELGSRLESLGSTVSSRFDGLRQTVSGLSSRFNIPDVFGGIFDKFAGFFATGGFIPSGQFGLVGERGPELISGPAQITPLDAVGSGANQNITYNISAVDARSFRELVARDPGFIHAVAQQGGRGIPTGRR
jgi:hypothetical protein